jgi:hypothetical protein
LSLDPNGRDQTKTKTTLLKNRRKQKRQRSWTPIGKRKGKRKNMAFKKEERKKKF